MELAPRYCRTCGSRILVKHICHNCNNEPLKGDNYCYDCGALTPNADSCLKCGAKYKQSFPVKPLLIGSLFIIAIAIASYFVLNSDNTQSSQRIKTKQTEVATTPSQEIPAQQEPIVNNPVDTTKKIAVAQADTAKLKTENKPDTTVLKTTPVDSANVNKSQPGLFTSTELKTYNARCSYFAKNQRGQIWFFIAGSAGYIKMNNKVYELKRKRKGVDTEVFSGNEYEAIITIDGLSGSAKEWLASCTLVVKDLTHNNSYRHKVFSSCIEL